MIIPVILSGGSGTRLWPLSRSDYPKQFIDLFNDQTLFQNTILRLPKEIQKPLIVCNQNHRFIVAEQLRMIEREAHGIILEPDGKNTAPALALAALHLIENIEDSTLLVLSADHLINDIACFHKSIELGNKLSQIGKLVTFGITPTYPETGYGYIEAMIKDNHEFHDIKSFKEKPDKDTAKKYTKSPNYFWNSGIFMFKASVYLNELRKYAPEILNICQQSLRPCIKDIDFIRINNDKFSKCPNDSIDYAVMEHTDQGVVVPFNADWNDVGSWSTLYKVQKKDENGNVTKGDTILDNVNNSFVYSSNRLIAAIGLSNVAIIDTQDALLVIDKKHDQNIKKIVEQLQDSNRNESKNHRKVFRPWGYYDSIDFGKEFQVKRISVNPKSKISLQKHKYRSEHWVVISGSAIITSGNKVYPLAKNQSTYIPQGQIHRLENPNDFELEIIEIQTGSYLGEDDIIRFEDDYERG